MALTIILSLIPVIGKQRNDTIICTHNKCNHKCIISIVVKYHKSTSVINVSEGDLFIFVYVFDVGNLGTFMVTL